MSTPQPMHFELTTDIAKATAGLVAGPLTASITGIIAVGRNRLRTFEAAAQQSGLTDDERSRIEDLLSDISNDLVALHVLRDALTMESFEDFRKAQRRVREMLAFSADDATTKLTPFEMTPVIAMVVALRHAAEMIERITREPMAESMAKLADEFGEMSDSEREALHKEHEAAMADNAAWIEQAQTSMDDVAIASLFREVGLTREAEGDDA